MPTVDAAPPKKGRTFSVPLAKNESTNKNLAEVKASCKDSKTKPQEVVNNVADKDVCKLAPTQKPAEGNKTSAVKKPKPKSDVVIKSSLTDADFEEIFRAVINDYQDEKSDSEISEATPPEAIAVDATAQEAAMLDPTAPEVAAPDATQARTQSKDDSNSPADSSSATGMRSSTQTSAQPSQISVVVPEPSMRSELPRPAKNVVLPPVSCSLDSTETMPATSSTAVADMQQSAVSSMIDHKGPSEAGELQSTYVGSTEDRPARAEAVAMSSSGTIEDSDVAVREAGSFGTRPSCIVVREAQPCRPGLQENRTPLSSAKDTIPQKTAQVPKKGISDEQYEELFASVLSAAWEADVERPAGKRKKRRKDPKTLTPVADDDDKGTLPALVMGTVATTLSEVSAPTSGREQPRCLASQDRLKDDSTDSGTIDVEEEQGVWVQCCKSTCGKWRLLRHVRDPSELADVRWDCSMNRDPLYASCGACEQKWQREGSYVYAKVTEGTLVLAKLVGYPWWPAMIEADPDEESYIHVLETNQFEPDEYHVVFFDKDKVTRAWLPCSAVKLFKTDRVEDEEVVKQGSLYTERLQEALDNAKHAESLSLTERLEQYGFLNRQRQQKEERRRRTSSQQSSDSRPRREPKPGTRRRKKSKREKQTPEDKEVADSLADDSPSKAVPLKNTQAIPEPPEPGTTHAELSVASPTRKDTEKTSEMKMPKVEGDAASHSDILLVKPLYSNVVPSCSAIRLDPPTSSEGNVQPALPSRSKPPMVRKAKSAFVAPVAPAKTVQTKTANEGERLMQPNSATGAAGLPGLPAPTEQVASDENQLHGAHGSSSGIRTSTFSRNDEECSAPAAKRRCRSVGDQESDPFEVDDASFTDKIVSAEANGGQCREMRDESTAVANAPSLDPSEITRNAAQYSKQSSDSANYSSEPGIKGAEKYDHKRTTGENQDEFTTAPEKPEKLEESDPFETEDTAETLAIEEAEGALAKEDEARYAGSKPTEDSDPFDLETSDETGWSNAAAVSALNVKPEAKREQPDPFEMDPPEETGWSNNETEFTMKVEPEAKFGESDPFEMDPPEETALSTSGTQSAVKGESIVTRQAKFEESDPFDMENNGDDCDEMDVEAVENCNPGNVDTSKRRPHGICMEE